MYSAISLYIHIPWCVKKCPYCDFNSHPQRGALPEKAYIEALLHDFESSIKNLDPHTLLQSIFIGGGTPSLFSPEAYQNLFEGLQKLWPFDKNIETTLEANPESVELARFMGYQQAGINRISVGVQSFNNALLEKLGRAHDAKRAHLAIETIQKANFHNFNIDLMFGLPSQTIEGALKDLKQALDYPPTHLSWYQLTLEPNTPFYQRPPVLPNDDLLWEIQNEGQTYLTQNGFKQYEVSAYTPSMPSQHNLNYWTFGDYIGIGCGAHGKLNNERIIKIRHPSAYLEAHSKALSLCSSTKPIPKAELAFEFMLNALRLTQGFSEDLFSQRTGLPLEAIDKQLKKAQAQGLLKQDPDKKILCPTPQGARFLNDLIMLFL